MRWSKTYKLGCSKGVYDPNTIKDGAPFGHDVANSLKWIEEKAKSDGFNVKPRGLL